MRYKTKTTSFILVGCIFLTVSVPFSCFSVRGDPDEVIYVENVYVLVMGRCRTIGSDGSWSGGLSIGTTGYVKLETSNTPLERLCVIINNESLMNPGILRSGLKRAKVEMGPATGIIFWGGKNSGISIFPPVVFAWCHVEKVWVSIYPEK